MTGSDVATAVEALLSVLEGAPPETDWDVPAGALDWSCRHTLAHLVDCLYWYASNLARRSISDAASPDVEDATDVEFHLDALRSAAALLALAVDAADDEARGWHPFGMADRTGFAAMGCDEVLVHGYDLSLGLALDFSPPLDVVERTLSRLFPWAPPSADPWDALLWANGRQALGERSPEVRWLWHCAPLDAWDGEIRRMP
jgi:uncharacterized protein (TIGR03083 family)